MSIERQEILTRLIAAARDAAVLVMRVYADADVGAELKGPNDPVTRADKEANASILARLAVDFPGVPVVAEESDPALFEGFERSSAAFFVDPVDGTRDFIAKNGEFCVMIGFAEEGRATVGVVLCPTYQGRSQTFGGALGSGAFLFHADGSRTPIHVGLEADLSRARCAVSRFHRSKSLDAKLTRLGALELRPIGSSGIKGVVVANGQVEIYAHPSRGKVKLWDACAPEAIVRAAGGYYTDASGVPFDYRGEVAQGQGTVAANPALHAEAVRRFVDYERTAP